MSNINDGSFEVVARRITGPRLRMLIVTLPSHPNYSFANLVRPMGEHTLRMQVTAVEDSITRVTLNGRLDTLGVGEIETLFVATLVPAGKSAIIDLSGVDFVASLGIRMLVSAARGMRQRQAKLALYNVRPLVQEVFDAIALSDIIPIGSDEDDARRLVSS